MDTAHKQEEEKPDKRGVVIMTHANIDPGAVVVHLHHTAMEK